VSVESRLRRTESDLSSARCCWPATRRQA
jgi:hypothetical protein